MRSGALSSDKVISIVNEFLVAVEINVTRQGFPPQLPAMQLVQQVYLKNWRCEFGFASCLVLDPTGKYILGVSSFTKSIEEELDMSKLFGADRYALFLVESLERWKKIQSIQALPPLQRIAAWTNFFVEIQQYIQQAIRSSLEFKPPQLSL